MPKWTLIDAVKSDSLQALAGLIGAVKSDSLGGCEDAWLGWAA